MGKGTASGSHGFDRLLPVPISNLSAHSVEIFIFTVFVNNIRYNGEYFL